MVYFNVKPVMYCRNLTISGKIYNEENRFPRVLRYERRSDIKEVDITEL